MKLKPRQAALCAGALLLLIAGFLAYRSLSRPQREVAAYKSTLLAKGEKLTVDQLLPEPVPFERNSAQVFNQSRIVRSSKGNLFDTNAPSAMQMVAPGKALIRSAQPCVRNEATNTWEEAERVFAQDDQAVELREQIIERPTLDFHRAYKQ